MHIYDTMVREFYSQQLTTIGDRRSLCESTGGAHSRFVNELYSQQPTTGSTTGAHSRFVNELYSQQLTTGSTGGAHSRFAAIVIPTRNMEDYVVDYSLMFSIDIEIIQAYIDGSIYAGRIDAKIIRDTHMHLDTHPDFVRYVMCLPVKAKLMVVRYYNIFDVDMQTERILRQEDHEVNDTIHIGSFVSAHYDTYVFHRDGLIRMHSNPYV